jgi:5-methylcytosine-specific restriction protein A
VLVLDGSTRCPSHQAAAGSFADARRGSRHARGYGTDWDRKRKRVLQRDNGLCQACKAMGRLQPGNQVDHRLPKADGGTDDEANLQTLCAPCHAAKTAGEAARGRGLG